MKALLIAEKNSLARAVRAAYQANGFNDTIDFLPLHGHIMALCDPGEYDEKWQDWSFDTLPMIPEEFRYKVIDQKLFDQIVNAIKSGGYDYLINCCDPDREGQHIFYSVYDSIGCNIPVKRMWHNDLSDAELMRALNNMEDDLKENRLINLKNASKLRAQMDWLVGMNASRIVTLKRRSLTRLGRVMSPTFRILAERELLIRAFSSDTSYGIEALYQEGFKAKLVELNDKKLENKTFPNKDECQQNIDKLPLEATITSIEAKQLKDNPPQLPSLADIQADANRDFGFTLDKTLEIVQSLYEKKLCSYPRTDCCYVTKEVSKDFDRILKAFAPTRSIGPFIGQITPKDIERVCNSKEYVNDAKVTAHYALIPTGNLTGQLSEDEKKLFEMICKRFVCIFLPPCLTEKTKVILDCDGKTFLANGSVVTNKGYRELMGNDKKDEILPALKQGQIVNVEKYNMSEHTTKAPSRFNDASLLNAMINAANYIEDKELSEILKGDQKVKDSGGIGTPATRAAIVEKIVQPIKNSKDDKMFYLAYRKSKYFYVTEEGLDLYQAIKEFDVSSPELTAIWEKKLKEIEDGLLSKEQFVADMDNYIISMSKQMMESDISYVSGLFMKCHCPKCNGRMKQMTNYYICENYKKETNSCDFIIGKKINGASISTKAVEDICNGNTSKAVKMKSARTGKEFYAGLRYNKQKQQTEFVFEDAHQTNYNCPICGAKMMKMYDRMDGDFLICQNKDFRVNYTISGRTLKEKEMKQFLEEKELKCTGFISRGGKEFSSKLIIENNKVAFYFGKKKENENK